MQQSPVCKNAAIVSLLEKRHGVRMHVKMLKRKLKNRPGKLRPVRRCFPSTFTLIIILNFILHLEENRDRRRHLYFRCCN